MQPFDYHFEEESSVPSPSLIYYKDIILQNTQTAIHIAGSADRLWPHVKSHKCANIIQMQCDLGIRRFKCATIAEAEIAATTDAEHILLAYPLVGPNIPRFLALQKAYPNKHFYALCDDLEQAYSIGDQAIRDGQNVSVLVDVNTGMNRTGVAFDRLNGFYIALSGISGITACGLHCYDGNRHEESYDYRSTAVKDTIASAQSAISAIQNAGCLCDILIMGGSPSFPCYASMMENCFFSPGTVFIYDAGYKAQFPDLPYEAGAAILTRVVSHPAPGIFTLDTGYKAISAEQTYRGILLDVPHAKELFQSEEHWTYAMEEGHDNERPAIGQELYVIPWHICPTTALYDHIEIVSDGHLVGEWPICARNRRLTY